MATIDGSRLGRAFVVGNAGGVFGVHLLVVVAGEQIEWIDAAHANAPLLRIVAAGARAFPGAASSELNVVSLQICDCPVRLGRRWQKQSRFSVVIAHSIDHQIGAVIHLQRHPIPARLIFAS